MAYENLLKSVEESAEERERELRENARKIAEELTSGAKKEGEARADSVLTAAKRSAEIERNRQVFLTKSEIKQQLIRVKETIFSQVFSDAEKQLGLLRKDPAYPLIFRNLAEETIQALAKENIRVHVAKEDEELCKKTLADMKVSAEIIPDIQTSGGLIAGTPDESITVSNTVESRLERGRERLKRELYTILFGG